MPLLPRFCVCFFLATFFWGDDVKGYPDLFQPCRFFSEIVLVQNYKPLLFRPISLRPTARIFLLVMYAWLGTVCLAWYCMRGLVLHAWLGTVCLVHM